MLKLNYSKFMTLTKEIAAQKGEAKALLFVDMHISALSIASNARQLWDLSEEETESFYRGLQSCIAQLHDAMLDRENNDEVEL